MLFTKLTGEPQSTREVYSAAMTDPDASGATGEAVIRALNERLYFSEISVMAQDIGEGLGSYSAEEVKEKLDKYFSELSSVRPLAPMTPRELLTRLKKKSAAGLRWPLKELNLSVGDLRIGNLVLVAARPESGKTTFLVSQTAGMLSQSTKPVLYLTNEDAGESIQVRYYQNQLKITKSQVDADPDAAVDAFTAMHGEAKLLVLDLNHEELNTWSAIEAAVVNLQPSIVVIDQLRNVRGFSDAGTEVARLKELFTHARSLSSRVCPIIVAHQLDGTSVGEMYPNENQLEGTKTEVQGALDVQIMIGRSYESGYEQVRGMNIVKNKLGHGSIADHRHRHGKFEIRIDEEYQNFTGVL
jgi:archaellum biogenesis ATPase FlaH